MPFAGISMAKPCRASHFKRKPIVVVARHCCRNYSARFVSMRGTIKVAVLKLLFIFALF